MVALMSLELLQRFVVGTFKATAALLTRLARRMQACFQYPVN